MARFSNQVRFVGVVVNQDCQVSKSFINYYAIIIMIVRVETDSRCIHTFHTPYL